MAEMKIASERRDRGRPQARPDDDTRKIIFEAARHAFAETGFSATSMDAVARRAGVSTKTLYRLLPSKAALFEGMVSDRLDRVLTDVHLQIVEGAGIEPALRDALMVCAGIAFDAEVVAMQRMVLQESGQFSNIASVFYRGGMQRTSAALADWLRAQQHRGVIALDDADEAAGMLIGMLTSAPQRAAIFDGAPLPSGLEIEDRVTKCATLFLRGCEQRSPK
jgi:AcrR family transcriptional regulator